VNSETRQNQNKPAEYPRGVALGHRFGELLVCDCGVTFDEHQLAPVRCPDDVWLLTGSSQDGSRYGLTEPAQCAGPQGER